MSKYSELPNLDKVLVSIEESIWDIYKTKEECLNELKRYAKAFPHEPDYNVAQYGRLLVSSYQVREMYNECGYKPKSELNDDQIWELYLHQVGHVVKQLIK